MINSDPRYLVHFRYLVHIILLLSHEAHVPNNLILRYMTLLVCLLPAADIILRGGAGFENWVYC